jgi:tetratricopeptide (TPR) repeat protein
MSARKKIEEQLAKGVKKKKKSNRIDLKPTETNIFNAGEDPSETGVWYFGNPSAVSIGQNEFKRVWGDIKLEDNWRRSLKVITGGELRQGVVSTDQNKVKDEPSTDAVVSVDPVQAEFAKLIAEVPYTDEQKEESLKKIEDAYFSLGDIYYFDLLEKGNALKYYQNLLARFPQSDYTPEVLYKIYLITKETNPEKAETYADILKRDYPNSSYAKILVNPEYLKEFSQTIEKQKGIYKDAYDNYVAENYVDALRLVEEAKSLGQSLFTPNLELLRVLIVGKRQDLST